MKAAVTFEQVTCIYFTFTVIDRKPSSEYTMNLLLLSDKVEQSS
ncbi:hypothetical protein T09_12166 [Trichinella sp. T9]|nr:hypothetical protein T09_12166 [Trichinella sp. T9]